MHSKGPEGGGVEGQIGREIYSENARGREGMERTNILNRMGKGELTDILMERLNAKAHWSFGNRMCGCR